MMTGEDSTKGEVYTFPAEGIYPAISVVALTIEEALELLNKART